MSNNGDDFEERIVARINAHTDALFAKAKADDDAFWESLIKKLEGWE